MAEKSRDAFRTISEVADWLDVPTHVLRFWESRFAQIKPVKRAGGRRYYRPSDMRVIGGVKVLLHDQGMTIRGVQKLFREEGVKHVSGYSPGLFDEDAEEEAVLDAEALEMAARPAPAARATHDAAPRPQPAESTEDEDRDEPTPIFRRTTQTAPGKLPGEAEETVTPEAEASGETEVEAVPEQEVAEATPILVGPDVPETDPEDDDDAHDRGPGPAARLKLVPRRRLYDEKARLESVVARLKLVLDKSA